MLKYVLQRLLALVIVLFLIVSASFFIVRTMPGSFIENPLLPKDVKEALESKYHLNEPLPVQYGYFLKDFSRLDFGISYVVRPKIPVNDVIMSKIPATLQVNIFSVLISIPLGLINGVVAALKKNSWIDHFISVKVIFYISIPAFVFASLLQYFIAFKLGWVPILVTTETTLTWSKFVSMILPILALSFAPIANITRFMRAELSEALNSDYMLLAKSKGLNQVQATIRHAIRNSLMPLSGILIGMIIGILGGALIIERIFGIPGLGVASLDAINSKDHTMTIGILFWETLIGLIGVLIVDLSFGIIDPRVRMGGKK